MDPYAEIIRTWSKVAGVYAEKFMDLTIYNATYTAFCERIASDNASILEIGCGPGNIRRFIKHKQPQFKIDAMDISPEMIEIARSNCSDVHFFVMDARDIGQLKKKYQGIICGFCIPFLMPEDFQKFMADCAALMDEQGSIYISFVEGEAEQSGYKFSSTGDRTYFNYYPLSVVKEALAKHGFSRIEVERVQFTALPGRDEEHTIVLASRMASEQAG